MNSSLKRVLAVWVAGAVGFSQIAPSGWAVDFTTSESNQPVPVKNVEEMENEPSTPEDEIVSFHDSFFEDELTLTVPEDEKGSAGDFDEARDKFDVIYSGYAVENKVTLEKVGQLRKLQDDLKKVLQDMIDAGEKPGDDLMKGFEDRVAQLDKLLTTATVVFEVDGRQVEVNGPQIMKTVYQEYQRLGLVSTADFDRLPGVSEEDLAGHETFEQYLDARQFVKTSISVFKGLSPYGSLTFVTDLIKKYGSGVLGGDVDADGLAEVDTEQFARMLNGTYEAWNAAKERIAAIEAEHGVEIPAQGVEGFEDLKDLMVRLDNLHADLRGVLEIAEDAAGEEVFRQLIRAEIEGLVSSAFSAYVNPLVKGLREGASPVDTFAVDSGFAFPAEGAVSFDEILGLARSLHGLNGNMQEKVDALLGGFEDGVLKTSISSVLNQEIYQNRDMMLKRLLGGIATRETQIHTIINEAAVAFPSGDSVSSEALNTMVSGMKDLRVKLGAGLKVFFEELEGLDIDAALKTAVRNEFLSRVNGKWTHQAGKSVYVPGVYETLFNQAQDHIKNRRVVFTLTDGQEVSISSHDLTLISGQMPADIDSLMRFPGIAAALTREQLDALEKQYDALGRTVSVDDYAYLTVDGSRVSDFALRVQLTGLLVEAYKDRVAVNGAVNVDEYRRALLMDEHLEAMFLSARGVIEASAKKIGSLTGDSEGVSVQTFQKIYEIIRDTNMAAVNILKLALDGVIYDARQLVTEMLQDSFNKMLAEADRVLGRAILKVTVGGRTFDVNAREVSDKIRGILHRVAVLSGNASEFKKFQYDRLNGIDKALLESLKTSYELDYYRQINFDSRSPSFAPDMNQTIAAYDSWYTLIPALIETHAGKVLDSNGNFSAARLADALLEDIHVPASAERRITDEMKDVLRNAIAAAKDALNLLDFSKWEDRLKGENLVYQMILDIEASSQTLIRELSQEEINILSSIANNYYQNGEPRFYDAFNLFYQKRQAQVASMVLPDGKVLKADFVSIQRIPGFPSSRYFDRELFPGVSDDDFKGADARSHSGIMLVKDAARTFDSFNNGGIDQHKLIANIIARYYKQPESVPEVYRDRLFVNNDDGTISVNLEIFRRMIKGVDTLHKTAMDELTKQIAEKHEEIQALKTEPMTVESIRRFYEEVSAFRAGILEHLNKLTQKHEIDDVRGIEGDLNKAFQEQIIDEMIDYVRSHALIVVVDGREIEVPVDEIVERMNGAISEKFPDADIAAHHYASFFGVSVSALRKFNKLEEFLGVQIIALPRTSAGEIVEVESKLSEIGMMELAEYAIRLYARSAVRDDGTIDIDALIAALNDPEFAMSETRKRADEIAASAHDFIAGVETPVTQETVFKLASVVDDMKLRMVNEINDAVSGFTAEMFAEIQAHVSALYEEIKAARLSLVLENPVVVTARDGSVFKISLKELEAAARTRVLELLADLPSDDFWEGGGMIRPIYYEQPLMSVSFDTAMVSYEKASFETAVIKPGIGILPPVIWHPNRGAYDPNDSTTEFGFMMLLVRLAERYGHHVLENGDFSREKFLKELGRTDVERAKEDFARLGEEAVAELGRMIPQPKEESVGLDTIDQVHRYLDKIRNEFVNLLNGVLPSVEDWYAQNDVRSAANAEWQKVIAEYEAQLFERTLIVEAGGRKALVDASALVEIIRKEFAEGYTSLIDAYTEGGEQDWEYSNYRTIQQQWYYGYGFDRYITTAGSGKAVSGDSAEKAGLSIYPFTLGDLNRLPGINSSDLSGLDVAAKDGVILTQVTARELLKGLLNMRVFAPGSGVQTIGSVQSAGMVMKHSSVVAESSLMAYDSQVLIDPNWQPKRYLGLSARDLMFRVVPAIVKDFFKDIVVDGKVDAEKFRDLLRNTEAVKAREKALVEKGLHSQAEAFAAALESGNEKLASMGLTGIVEQDRGGAYYLVVHEPRLHRIILHYLDEATGLIRRDAADAEGFDELLAATKLSKDELFTTPGHEIRQLIPAVRYLLGRDIYYINAYGYTDTSIKAPDGADPVYHKNIYWGDYAGKMIHLGDSRVSFRINENGQPEGTVHHIETITGIQFAKEASAILTASKEAFKAQQYRETYLDRFIRRTADHEAKLVTAALMSQIEALNRALETGDPELGNVGLAGTVQRDGEGYYLEVPEPFWVVYLQKHTNAETGLLNAGAVTPDFTEATGLTFDEAVNLPVEKIWRRLPVMQYRIGGYYGPVPVPVEQPPVYIDDPRDTAAGENLTILPYWDLEAYIGKTVHLKGNLSYELTGSGLMQGRVSFIGGIEELVHAENALNLLRNSDEARKALTLRNAYRDHFLGKNSPEAKKAVEEAKENLLSLFKLSDREREDFKDKIEVVSAERQEWSNGCVGFETPDSFCTMAFVKGFRVVLKLFENIYEFHAGRLNPAHAAAIQAVNRLVSEGENLADIRINSSEIIENNPFRRFYPADAPDAAAFDTAGIEAEIIGFPVELPVVRYRVELSIQKRSFEIVIDRQGNIHSIEERDGGGRILSQLDENGWKTRFDYRGQTGELTGLEFSFDGRVIYAGFDKSPASIVNAAGSVKAAVKDMVRLGEIEGESRLRVTSYEEGLGVCAKSLPPSCSGSASLQIESAHYRYAYEVTMRGGYRFTEFDVRQVSKKPLLPETDLPKEALTAIARQLNIALDDILDIKSEDRDFVTCLGTGCATWSKYISVTIRTPDGKKHFAGTVTGGWWGHAVPVEVPVMADGPLSMYAAAAAPLTLQRNVKIRPFFPPVVKLPVVELIEADPRLDGRAVEAIAREAGVSIRGIQEIGFSPREDMAACQGTRCAVWTADLRVVVQRNDNSIEVLIGEISEIFDIGLENKYRVSLKPEVEEVQFPTEEEMKIFNGSEHLQYYGVQAGPDGIRSYDFLAVKEGEFKIFVEINPCRDIPYCKAMIQRKEITVRIVPGSKGDMMIALYSVDVDVMGDVNEVNVPAGLHLLLFNIPDNAVITAIEPVEPQTEWFDAEGRLVKKIYGDGSILELDWNSKTAVKTTAGGEVLEYEDISQIMTMESACPADNSMGMPCRVMIADYMLAEGYEVIGSYETKETEGPEIITRGYTILGKPASRAEDFIPVEKMDEALVKKIRASVGEGLKLLGMRIVDKRPVDGELAEEFVFEAVSGENHAGLHRMTQTRIIRVDESGTMYEEMKMERFAASITVNPDLRFIQAPGDLVIQPEDGEVAAHEVIPGQRVVIRIVKESGFDLIAPAVSPWDFRPFQGIEDHFAVELALHHQTGVGSIEITEIRLTASTASPCSTDGICAFAEVYEVKYTAGGKEYVATGTKSETTHNGIRNVNYSVTDVRTPAVKIPVISMGSETYSPHSPLIADAGHIRRLFLMAEGWGESGILHISRQITAEGHAVSLEILDENFRIPEEFDGLNYYVRFESLIARADYLDLNGDGVVDEDDFDAANEPAFSVDLNHDGVVDETDRDFARFYYRPGVRRLFAGQYNQTVPVFPGEIFMVDLFEGGYTSHEYTGTWKVQGDVEVRKMDPGVMMRIENFLKKEDASAEARAVLAKELGVKNDDIRIEGMRATKVINAEWRKDDSIAEVYRIGMDTDIDRIGTDVIRIFGMSRFEADVFVMTDGTIRVQFTDQAKAEIEKFREVLDARKQAFWKPEFSRLIAEILGLKEDQLRFTITQKEIDETGQTPVCAGPGCADRYPVKVTTAEGRVFQAKVSHSWDGVTYAGVFAQDGTLLGEKTLEPVADQVVAAGGSPTARSAVVETFNRPAPVRRFEPVKRFNVWKTFVSPVVSVVENLVENLLNR